MKCWVNNNLSQLLQILILINILYFLNTINSVNSIKYLRMNNENYKNSSNIIKNNPNKNKTKNKNKNLTSTTNSSKANKNDHGQQHNVTKVDNYSHHENINMTNNKNNTTTMNDSFLSSYKHHQFNQSKPIEVTICSVQCEKISMIFGCYCDSGCKKYGDCCKIYSPECINYFDQVEVDHFELPEIGKDVRVGTCCEKSQPPVNCFCDELCERTGDCCKDYHKCSKNITNILVKTIN